MVDDHSGSDDQRSVTADDLDECWCCGGLHDAVGALCPACDDAGCSHFGDECHSDHKPVFADGGHSGGGVYRSDSPTHGGYGMPRGPIPTIPEKASTVAIGFCPMCGTNARGTCSNRGAFDCPRCTYWWFDDRVGKQTRSFEDYFSPDESRNDCYSDTDSEQEDGR